MEPLIIIGDADDERCPYCGGEFIRKKIKEQIIKTCSQGHQFIVKNPIITKESEEKCSI